MEQVHSKMAMKTNGVQAGSNSAVLALCSKTVAITAKMKLLAQTMRWYENSCVPSSLNYLHEIASDMIGSAHATLPTAVHPTTTQGT